VASDEYTERLHKKVQDVRQNKEWRREYMTLEMMLDEKLEEGIEQGLEQGLEQGTIITNMKFYYKGKISKEEVMEELSVDKEKFEEYLKEFPKEELLK
jgi:flagellar biosynthesis/type III secretory pathway protein FliH